MKEAIVSNEILKDITIPQSPIFSWKTLKRAFRGSSLKFKRGFLGEGFKISWSSEMDSTTRTALTFVSLWGHIGIEYHLMIDNLGQLLFVPRVSPGWYFDKFTGFEKEIISVLGLKIIKIKTKEKLVELPEVPAFIQDYETNELCGFHNRLQYESTARKMWEEYTSSPEIPKQIPKWMGVSISPASGDIQFGTLFGSGDLAEAKWKQFISQDPFQSL